MELFCILIPRIKETCRCYPINTNRINGVMGSVLALSAVDRGFESRSGQTKDYKIGICCFSAKYPTLRRKNKDWLARNQDIVSEWGNMSIRSQKYYWIANND